MIFYNCKLLHDKSDINCHMTLIIIKQCGLLTLNIINYVIILHINLLRDIVSYYIMTLIININLINAEIIAPFSSFLLREKIVLSQDNFCVGGDIQGGGRYISQGISPLEGSYPVENTITPCQSHN